MTERSRSGKKVALGLSGGVDSSVAALLLKEQGYEVTGVFMKCWDEKADGCTAEEDRASAVQVAGELDIKFKDLDYTKEYEEKVISYFFEEYRAGRTPNPDVVCNKDIKFGLFLDWALEEGYDHIATGHYARISSNKANNKGKSDVVILRQGIDSSKDQSYFLYRLEQRQLTKTLFPLGELTKEEVRAKAKQAGLSTYNRPDSQGICFIGKVDIKRFLQERIKPKKGKVVHVNGKDVGEHDGVWYYTIGQRHGFKVDKYFGLPLYVVDKDVENNVLVVGFAKDVLKDSFLVEDIHWISGEMPERLKEKGKLRCRTRIRHLGKLHDSEIKLENGTLEVKMKEPSFGIAPGQSAVFYGGDTVLGGGIIS